MTRSTIPAVSRRINAHRARFVLAALFTALFTALAQAPAAACEIWAERSHGRPEAVAPAHLPEALTSAHLRCGNDARPVLIWTLAVDGAAPHLGVRDEPLFRTDVTGPLLPVAEAAIPGAANLSVLVRASAAATIDASGPQAPSYRRFATFCDAAESSEQERRAARLLAERIES